MMPPESRVFRLQSSKPALEAFHLLGGFDAELVDDLDEPPQTQYDDERGDLLDHAVFDQVHDEAHNDDEGIEHLQPIRQISAGESAFAVGGASRLGGGFVLEAFHPQRQEQLQQENAAHYQREDGQARRSWLYPFLVLSVEFACDKCYGDGAHNPSDVKDDKTQDGIMLRPGREEMARGAVGAAVCRSPAGPLAVIERIAALREADYAST